MGAFALGALMMLATIDIAFAEGGHGHGGGMGGRGGVHSSAGIAGHAQTFSGSRFHSAVPHNSGATSRGGFPLHNAVAVPRGSFVARYPSSHYAGSRYSTSRYPSYGHSATWNHRSWQGGNWRGTYWPRAYYYSGFPWLLASLPLLYTTFWFDDVPYYYVDRVYYTWNAADNGYVATDPPPVSGTGAAESGDVATGKVFAYPKNGQSEQQQATDQQECREWASTEAGAGATTAVTSTDFNRAVVACLEGRGYSAK